jgi:hypothetical protein
MENFDDLFSIDNMMNASLDAVAGVRMDVWEIALISF